MSNEELLEEPSKKKKKELIEGYSSGSILWVDLAKGLQDKDLTFYGEWDSGSISFDTLYQKKETTGSGDRFEVYDTTTISDDVKEIMVAVHRTEGKVDRIMNMLEKMSGESENSEEDIACQEISDDEAKVQIIEYMKTNKEAWPQDISATLHIDFAQVMRVTCELLDEGVLNDSDQEAESKEEEGKC